MLQAAGPQGKMLEVHPAAALVIVEVDRREQRPWLFEGEPVETVPATIDAGDYRLQDHPQCVVERKSPGDLLGCLTAGRGRFEEELERLAALDYAAVVVEGGWRDLTWGVRNRINPASVAGSLIAWSQRYGVHFWPMPSRRWAEKFALRLLLRFRLDVLEGKWPMRARKENAG